MTSVDEILTAVFKVLDADLTLQGATYLNGTDKIEKNTRRKENFVNPTVTMKTGGTGIDMEIKVQDATVYVNVFVDNNTNGTANTSKLSRIAKRIESLLDDTNLTISGSRVFNCFLTAPHSGPYFDQSFPDEHYVSSVFRIQIIDLT
jgi:hypothetical protein